MIYWRNFRGFLAFFFGLGQFEVFSGSLDELGFVGAGLLEIPKLFDEQPFSHGFIGFVLDEVADFFEFV